MVNLLKPEQVAELLNCKPSSIYFWAKTGKIPAIKLNGILRFDPEEIALWVKEGRVVISKPFKTFGTKPIRNNKIEGCTRVVKTTE